MTIKLATNDKIAETSSKGNQEKWLEDGYWFKLDQFGYEALAEVMTSKLLEFSNIEKETPFTFARYEMQIINLHGFERVACVSKNFLKKNQSIITVSALFKKCYDVSIKRKLASLQSDKKRIESQTTTPTDKSECFLGFTPPVSVSINSILFILFLHCNFPFSFLVKLSSKTLYPS